jgi:hypothetical protein
MNSTEHIVCPVWSEIFLKITNKFDERNLSVLGQQKYLLLKNMFFGTVEFFPVAF